MRSVKIIQPGLHTTVQDRGRSGFLRYGLPASGPMDRALHDAANALLGNDPAAATLEATGTLPELEVQSAMRIAVAYADHHEVIAAAAGDRIMFDRIATGYRAYLAFEGGIEVPIVMGSRSTYVAGKLGGFEGRALRAGDLLFVDGASSSVRDGSTRVAQSNGAGTSVYEVRVIPGPEANWFDAAGLNTFLTSAFTASAKSDRTGVRLDGPRLSFRADEQMVSAGLAMGTIQVPPSGQPIIMMADHPTTGGYPRIGCVAEADLALIAQLKPGDPLRFHEDR